MKYRDVHASVTLLMVVGLWLIAFGEAQGFGRATHAGMTNAAFGKSVLATDPLIQQLGLGTQDPSNPFGLYYYDVSGVQLYLRQSDDPNYLPTPYEAKFMKETSRLSIDGWLMRGAIREDDFPLLLNSKDNNPQDDPFTTRYRVLHHFFDPYHNSPLTTVGCALEGGCMRSPDWALGYADAFASPPVANTTRLNHFTIVDAHESMWRAATGVRFSDGGPVTPSGAAATQLDRLAYWATTFRALGDVIHHIQDMAQPQHTRDDPHPDLGCDPALLLCFSHASYFEKYLDARAIGEGAFDVDVTTQGITSVPLPILVYDRADLIPPQPSYPIATFSRYPDYWSTAVQGLTGLGMADYSSRGFYTAGTNIGSVAGQTFPLPNAGALTDFTEQIGTAKSLGGDVLKQPLVFKLGSVPDSLTNVADAGVRLSTYGVFDQFLQLNGKPPAYSLNYNNYNDQANLLLPRAVAYSAGLLNFFFRGTMAISLPDEGVYGIVDHSKFGPSGIQTNANFGFKGFDKIRLKLLNTTPSITTPTGATVAQGMTSGTLVAVLKFHRNTCYVDNLDGQPLTVDDYLRCRSGLEEIVTSDAQTSQSVPATGDADYPNGKEFTFRFQNELPINAWDVYLQLVYRGQLGTEADDVVLATKDIAEPLFVTLHNDTDYITIGNVCYLPSVVAGNSSLMSQLAPACKSTSGQSTIVSPACVNVPFNLRHTFGSTTAQITVATEIGDQGDGRLQPGRFSRYAVLGDTDAPINMTFTFNNPPLYLPGGNVIPYLPAPYPAELGVSVGPFGLLRGIRQWTGGAAILVVDGSIGSVGEPCDDATMSSLHESNPYPQPVTIRGW